MAASDSPTGTVVFSTVGRCFYGFDIFSVPLTTTTIAAEEHRLTDGKSINFNGSFTHDNQTLVFISERTGAPRIYLARPRSNSPGPTQLPSAPGSLFHDRPILRDGKLFFVSAHEPSDSLYKSWSAVYAAEIGGGDDDVITRLTPDGVVDYSPAISRSGELMAVASYGSELWGGEIHELDAEIVVFPVSNPTERIVLATRGGWPTWAGDSTVFIHHESEDGWWSIYRVEYPPTDSPRRVTPPGLHAFTPAAFHDSKRIAVATRRKESDFRHIEIFDIDSGKFQPITKLLNPEIHHYNPFVSPRSDFLGYHRFRGESASGDSIIPNLEPVLSPIKSLNMLRLNGSFPEFSPDGDLIAYNPDFDSNSGVTIVKSDGSNRWKLIKDRIAFYNSWNPADKNVIFTSVGGIFQPANSTVQIARITFDASKLDPHRADIPNVDVKILTKESTGNNGFPACSPDGKSVVFRSGRSGHKNLYIMDAVIGEFDGGYIRQLTNGACIDTMPSWSPDGELIVFSSNRHDPSNPVTFGIYIIRADGSGLRRVHVEGSSDVDMERINHVCFSPNGEWLLFTANMGGVTAEPVSLPNQFQPYGELFVVRLDGSGVRRLTLNGYENGTPAWHSRVDYNDLDDQIRRLSLNGDVEGVHGDELKGQFQEPLWITCDF